MLKNFTRPKDEKPYYYSTTVEGNEVVRHDNEPNHAVYQSETREIQRRADLWHKWVQANVPNAYDSWGVLDSEVANKYWDINRQFIDGERES